MLGLCGIENMGNTCYMNSVLQCLYGNKEFIEYYLSKQFLKSLTDHETNALSIEYYRMVHTISKNSDGYITPSQFHRLVVIISHKYSNGELRL